MIRALIGNPLFEAYKIIVRNNVPDPDEFIPSYRMFNATTWDDVEETIRYLGVEEECAPTVSSLKESMRARPYPAGLNMGDGSHIALHEVRRKAVARYAWAIPSDDALEVVAKHGPIVEIGAGTGYWAALLASRGVDIVCYDGDPPVAGAINHWHEEEGVYHPVEQGGPEMAALHPDRTLFLCWPPYAPEQNMSIVEPADPENWTKKTVEYEDRGQQRSYSSWYQKNEHEDIAYQALMAYEAAGGKKVIYIGEGSGGCTAGPCFHARLGEGCDHWGDEKPCKCPQPRWAEIDACALPQWEGIHDNLYVYEHRVPELMPGE